MTSMLFTSGQSSHSHLAQSIFEFFTSLYGVKSDVEVFHTDLTDDNAFGFTEINGDEQFIQIHNDLNENDYITTLLHELVHVVQNENGQFDDTQREEEAYGLESILFNQFRKLHKGRFTAPPHAIINSYQGKPPHATHQLRS